MSEKLVLMQTAQQQEKERGAGDWQHYQSPSDVLKAVAQRKPPGPPGPPRAPSGPPAGGDFHILWHLHMWVVT